MNVSTTTRDILMDRCGRRCERCGRALYILGHSVHHRRPRGMGGTRRPESNQPENLLVLCGSGVTGCHGWVESNRSAAYATGFLVPQVVTPDRIPVQIWQQGTVFLTADGYSAEQPALTETSPASVKGKPDAGDHP